MKTLEELYSEVIASDELKKEFCSLKSEEVENFAEKHGCKATLDEIKAFLTEKSAKSGELSDDEIAQVAGGKGMDIGEAITSVFTLGTICAVLAGISSKVGKCGTDIKDDRMLCKID